MKETYKFKSIGLVLGYYWGGGKGSYPTKKLYSDSREELIEEADKKLKDGSLDSGMGYESLIGAILYITKTTSIDYNGKIFSNEETEMEFIGNLTEEEEDFLTSNTNML